MKHGKGKFKASTIMTLCTLVTFVLVVLGIAGAVNCFRNYENMTTYVNNLTKLRNSVKDFLSLYYEQRSNVQVFAVTLNPKYRAKWLVTNKESGRDAIAKELRLIGITPEEERMLSEVLRLVEATAQVQREGLHVDVKRGLDLSSAAIVNGQVGDSAAYDELTRAVGAIFGTDAYQEDQDALLGTFNKLQDSIIARVLDDCGRAQLVMRQSIIFLIAILCFLLMMVLFVHFAVRGRIIAPMQILEEHFGKISKGDLHTKVSLAEDGTEIGELVAAANRMQDMFSRYIKEVETVLYELSQGNLGQTVSDNFTGDFVKIRESLIAILSSYKASFEEINNAAFEVSNGSEQIAMSSQTLSEGATEQASTIQELTANVNEVSARISETAENAEDVKKAAVEMTEVIQTGNQSLSQLAGTMKELNKYSSDIYKIVKTIDNIAFQTNILALNASVEAARAEQNGASFSVVADEVRALAAQSAKSAQATAQLIEDTLNAIKTGVETAVSTEELLSAIVGRAENVKHRVIKITEAMESDSVAVQQALASLEQLSSIVQANSANAEETAAASEEISAQASAMMDLVRRFS